VEGNGRSFNRFEIIRIELSGTVDFTKARDSRLPDDLDITNYEEVANYFGF